MGRKKLRLTHVNNQGFLVDTAYNDIHDAIVSNELEPGTALSEGALSKHFGISRTPVREALKRLEEQRLVKIVPRKGAFVTEISTEKIIETYQLREALECFAVQFVPKYGDPKELDDLIYGFEQSQRWIDEGKIDQINDLDIRLHRFIAHSSRNEMLCTLEDQLLNEVTRLRRMVPTVPGRLGQQREEQLRIVNALKAGNVEEAQKELRNHLRAVCDTDLQTRPRLA